MLLGVPAVEMALNNRNILIGYAFPISKTEPEVFSITTLNDNFSIIFLFVKNKVTFKLGDFEIKKQKSW